jgi:cell division protease FtsH
VTRFGMDPKLGLVAYETERSSFLHGPGMDDWQPRHYGEVTADAIDNAVRRLIDDAFERARTILATNKDLLLESAAALLVKETLSEDELRPFAARLKRPDGEPVGPVAVVRLETAGALTPGQV